MPFNYQAQPLPILEPGQMNPFNQAVQSGLSTFQKGMEAGYTPATLKENLLKAQLENQINQVKAKYAPMTVQADAASKMAYARLMGPQFLAKMMGNTDILANLPDDKKQQALQMLYQAGSNQGLSFPNAMGNNQGLNSPPQTGNNQNFNAPAQQNQNISPIMKIINGARNSSMLNQDQMQQENMPNMGRAIGYNIPPNPLNNNESFPIQNEGSQSLSQPSSFAQNVGAYKGLVEEGKETGKIRANDIKDLNEIAFNTENNQTTLDDLSSILKSSDFEKIRQVPILGHNEIGYYAKFGTKNQQQIVGRYLTDTGNIIKDSARDFKGAFRVGEQRLLNSMKANPNDTVDVARGKVESLSFFNKMLNARSKLTSKYMNDYHINKLQASELADKQINGEQIRSQIQDKINPMVTIKNKKTGETVTLPFSEAQKRMRG